MSEQLPQYQCHKVVRAGKVVKFPNASTVHCEVDGEIVHVSIPVALGHARELVGGYIMIEDNGYITWSPAAPFESGHERLDAAEETAEDDEETGDDDAPEDGEPTVTSEVAALDGVKPAKRSRKSKRGKKVTNVS